MSLCFGPDVRTRLGVAIFEVSGPPVFYMKVGIPLSALPKDKTSRLVGSFSTLFLFYDERQAGKL